MFRAYLYWVYISYIDYTEIREVLLIMEQKGHLCLAPILVIIDLSAHFSYDRSN